jgi:hypothetical protein
MTGMATPCGEYDKAAESWTANQVEAIFIVTI